MESTHQQAKLKAELEKMFAHARGEIFEDGMESDFSRNLVALIEQHQEPAIAALAELIAGDEVNAEVASEALRWVVHIENPATHQARLTLLEHSLSAPSARVRDGAALGLASMDDPASIDSVQEAINHECIEQLRQNLEQVLEQLVETRDEQSSLTTMLDSEEVLRRDWDSDAEDDTWAYL